MLVDVKCYYDVVLFYYSEYNVGGFDDVKMKEAPYKRSYFAAGKKGERRNYSVGTYHQDSIFLSFQCFLFASPGEAC